MFKSSRNRPCQEIKLFGKYETRQYLAGPYLCEMTGRRLMLLIDRTIVESIYHTKTSGQQL